MRSVFKFLFIFVCLFIIFISPVYAVGIDMDIDNNVDTSNVIDLPSEEENTVPNTSSTTKVSTTQTSEDFTLSVSDIINIILIAVGIVLIFLSIAILIRIKN